MKADRYFYTSAGAVFLLLMLIGFRAFYTHGTGVAGRVIDPTIFAIVAVHGIAIACWFVLFFTQALLIATKNRKLHMTLGWSVLGLGPLIAVLGMLVAIRSVQHTPAEFHFFGILYSRFLLVMLTEMAMFAVFVTAGVLARKRPKIHRPMMMLASLTILPGATGRIPALTAVFGPSGWSGLFGPIFVLGAALLLIRWAQTRRFDEWFAGGYALMVIAFTASEYLALTDMWGRMASVILKL